MIAVEYVNLTGHPVIIMPEDGETVSIPPTGAVLRIAENVRRVDGRAVVELGEIAGLPDPVDGTVYVTSMPVLMALAAKGIHRPDLTYPYGRVKADDGRTLGCRELATLRVA
ncbi:hypothetical protein Drose_06065 [Dactylosporangium roseum]|uniref:Uncharacterized protein n=1 Tax=Dactylosporangium roseum TaxID=47989 RepID=A0ABY5Z8N7_9ACTN|nr:hypothetical protein [Dactylosporangium roseum]UWZ37837.1 hypothetical protein Drose_06065 [Dactylosporangium roseum]